ncbi:dehydrogenase [Methanosarcina sp. MSH10X1]|uniref:F420H2 dehydrogenase subunit FpoO n=1 Tax=Methanosarcina sp. MSH10X1 TaxID=2507075 RepID=UPI000FFCBB7A|nr:F420H2 dehydrogenase subunit FpoO [Methanosarcina sp. MSH10X1]RXA19488.1 dehydrogenase [Methanosarcina sp. MSH10X1]
MNPKSGCIPVRVFRLFHKFIYSNGAWKELCETCLDSAQKTYLSIDKDELSCRRNKCVLCGRKGRVYPVEIQIPDFSKGIVKKDVNVCTNCLESINETYIRFKREQIERSACEYGHEHVHEH